MSDWTKLKEAAAGYDCPEKEHAWKVIARFVDAALASDELNMNMTREDIERIMAEYNKAKKALLNDPT